MSTTTTTTTTPWRTIGPVLPPEHPRAAAVLSAAFVDDPVFTWIEPDRRSLAGALPAVFTGFLESFAPLRSTDAARLGQVTTGVALWAPPGQTPDPADGGALGAAIGLLSADAQGRTGQLLEAFAAVHPEEPAWYLNFLAVAPGQQGHGLGSALLRNVLDRCDRAGEAAYTEATCLRNRALYARHGFRLLQEIPLPGGPTTYAMWREPVMPPRPSWPPRSER